jgi:hypothetical protein
MDVWQHYPRFVGGWPRMLGEHMTTVFYSWQSDLPNATNRGLIERALETAITAIHTDDAVAVEPVIDRDTLGAVGAVDIASIILAKIESAAAFVADVSIINGGVGRPSPNPNVLIELGYALGYLGTGRVVMVVNEAYGSVEQLPFDLRMRRTARYTCHPADSERAAVRRHLAPQLETALRSIFEANPLRPDRMAAASGMRRQARILLYHAAQDPDGFVIIHNVFGGRSVQTGGKAWPLGNADARARAKWVGAVTELADQGFLETVGHKGEVFRLTHEGFEAAERFGLDANE